MKKLSFLLTIILLLSAFSMVACKKEAEHEDATSVTTAVTTTASEEDNPIVYPSIAVGQLVNYEIVSAKSSSEEVDKLTSNLQQQLQSRFDLPINLKTENAYNKTQYEILIGNTNREESATFLTKYNMTWNDYGYGIVGDKLVIRGANEDGTLEALRAFIDYISKHDGGEVFFSNANLYLVTDTSYPCKNLAINNIPVAEFSILCNQQELGGIAQTIQGSIIEACGIALPMIADADVKDGDKLIIIGESAYVSQALLADWNGADVSGNAYYFGTDANTLWVNANTAAGYLGATNYILSQLVTDNTLLNSGKYEGKDAIAVMSFNLMVGSDERPESKRLDAVTETILKYRPAVIGVQEATDMWIGLLQQRLGDIYTIVGDGREANRGGEHSAILFLTEKFELIKSETKWLSETPNVPGSQHSTAVSEYPRIMTYVHLSRKSDGKQLLHVNTHLDYGTTPEQEAVKVAQMGVIFEEIQKLNLGDVPTVITGDFNATVDSPVYETITSAEWGYQDSCPTSAIQLPTYHALMGTTGTPSHIDFIFGKNMDTHYYRICTERVNNENVSDHYPIISVLSFSKK